ncbi:MAG TPA: hypothetical protein VHQ47_14880 [Phycisphaerae bacterium]|jgi:hypothetical protein|nr:hypothetical protein [Phycisphaerae bacterium]
MKLETIFLLLDEHPQKLMFICPACDHQNFTAPTRSLGDYRCEACGITLDAADAELEVLAHDPQPAAQPILWM